MGRWRKGACCPGRPGPGPRRPAKVREPLFLFPEGQGHAYVFTQLAHPNLEARTAQGPLTLSGDVNPRWKSLEAGRWLLGCLPGRGGVGEGEGETYPKSSDTLPSLPEFLSSNTLRKFPQLPSLHRGRDWGCGDPAGAEAQIWGHQSAFLREGPPVLSFRALTNRLLCGGGQVWEF